MCVTESKKRKGWGVGVGRKETSTSQRGEGRKECRSGGKGRGRKEVNHKCIKSGMRRRQMGRQG